MRKNIFLAIVDSVVTIPAIPKPIQRAVLPAAIRGQRDVVGAAETGSGKTLAFAIPILNGILEYNRSGH